MIDREKVMTLRHQRFPGARLCEVAAAANALVGLDPEFDPLMAPGDVLVSLRRRRRSLHHPRRRQ